jgi:chromosome segregation ATPase
MSRQSPAVVLGLFAGLLLLAPSAGATDSQILETLYRSEDELNHQIKSLQKSYDLLSRALKQQAAAAHSNNDAHVDRKHRREEIVKQIWLLQRELKYLDEGSDVLAKDSSTNQEEIYKTKQNLDAVATQLDQSERALIEVRSAIRQAQDTERGQR